MQAKGKMTEESDDKKIDVFLKMYERNEQYHDVKEKTIWLGGTVYATFSVVAIKLIADYKHKIETIPGLATWLKWSLAAIGLSAGLFVLFQYLHKCESAVKTEKFLDLVPRLRSATYTEIREAPRHPPKKPGCGLWKKMTWYAKRFKDLRHGKPGFLILIAMGALFAIQMRILLG